MKRLLATLLILCAGPVWAEWIAITKVLPNESQFFIDLSTVKGTHTKKFWMYANHGSQNKHGQSSRDFMQIRCDDDEFRTIKSDTFSGKDLTGSLISSHDNLLDWGPIPPGSVVAYLQTLVCGKK